MITADQFKKSFPANPQPEAWAEALNALMPKYGIDTPKRMAAFLAQCGHESEGFTKLTENLNYSAEALTRTWPKHFPPEIAAQYARKPEQIANRAYADRMGNGPEDSGDGWRHRGRGPMQVTGKENYILFSKAAGIRYVDVFPYLVTVKGGAESACWYWASHALNTWADNGDFITLTKRVNGGLLGLADRQALLARITEVLK